MWPTTGGVSRVADHADPHEPDHEPGHADAHAEHSEGHGSHAKGHGGHGGEGHGGGGHGGSWLITYCDMITLLMAMFICIITFASKEPERYAKKKDSLMYGAGGTGIAGMMQRGMEQDSIVWRRRPMRGRVGPSGSEMPPRFSESALESTAEVLRGLEETGLGTLEDNYGIRVPLALLFASDGRISPSGKQVLQAVARNVKSLPYDIHLQVNAAANVAKAVMVAKYLWEQQGILPGRMGVGVREAPETWSSSLWMTFHRRRT